MGWLDFLFDNYYKSKWRGEKMLREVAQRKAITMAEKAEESDAAYHSVLKSLRKSRDEVNVLEEACLAKDATIEELHEVIENMVPQGSIIDALMEYDKTAEAWLDVDELVNNYFGVHVSLQKVDMAVYRANFMSTIYNHILNNRGDFQYEDSTEMRSCSAEELQAALDRDFISNIGYVLDLWDCENRADAVKSRMARIYGITSIRRVCAKTSTANHAFCYFYNKDGEWVFEPGSNVMWALNTPGLPDIFRVDNWYDYR